MSRAIVSPIIGLLLTAAAMGFVWFAIEPDAALARAIGLGGGLGSTIAGASAGAQVGFVRRRPLSNASLAAMVVGFFAKLLVLVVGIWLIHRPDAPALAPAFGVSFVVAAGIVTAISLSAIARTFRS